MSSNEIWTRVPLTRDWKLFLLHISHKAVQDLRMWWTCLDVSKSVSRALSAFYVEKLGTSSVDYRSSKLVSSPITSGDYVTESQWRVGSLYFPQSSVRTIEDGSEPSAVDLYIMALQSFGRKGCVTTLERFTSDSAILGVSLERSTVTELAGIPLSNSRMLSLNVSWNTAASARKYNVFLKHAVLIRCFANSISVEVWNMYDVMQ